jgi:hypothetical protein
MHEILTGPEIPLRRLNRSVAEEESDLFQFADSRASSRTYVVVVGTMPGMPETVLNGSLSFSSSPATMLNAGETA